MARPNLARMLRSAAAKNYWTDRLYYEARLAYASPRDPILVYSVGKVGSSAVVSSLPENHPDIRCYHVHWLVPEHLRKDERYHRRVARRLRGTPIARSNRPTYLWAGHYFSKRVVRPPKGATAWKVVTLVRDPVARNVSSMFQNLRLLEYDWRTALDTRPEAEVVDELIDLFVRTYVTRTRPFEVDGDPLTWFDRELKTVFGVDVYSKPFPVDRGYTIYENSRARVLVLRSEDLGARVSRAFRDFLGLERVSLSHQNVTADKDHGSLYRSFCEALRLPEDYLDRVYGGKLVQHFYSEDETAAFRRRWSDRVHQASEPSYSSG